MTAVSVLQSVAAAETTKNRHSRVFWGCSSFDFCNSICEQRTCRPVTRAILSIILHWQICRLFAVKDAAHRLSAESGRGDLFRTTTSHLSARNYALACRWWRACSTARNTSGQTICRRPAATSCCRSTGRGSPRRTPQRGPAARTACRHGPSRDAEKSRARDISLSAVACANARIRNRDSGYRQLRKKKVHVPFVHQRLHEQSSGPRNLWIGLTAYFA
jgi:hypothetical protein